LHVGQGITIDNFDDIRMTKSFEGFDFSKYNIDISGYGYI